jgi:excisionase family DNA binding protein
MFDLGDRVRFHFPAKHFDLLRCGEGMETITDDARTEIEAQIAELTAQISELRRSYSDEPLAYTFAAACEKANLSRPTLQKEINAGRLRIRRFGRKVLIERDELRRFIAALPD